MIKILQYSFFLTLITAYSVIAKIGAIYVLKEIDDDNIIIVTEEMEKLLLEKWSLRFSPLIFEGKIFIADITPLWVTIYFDDRESIKWTVEESLGFIETDSNKKGKKKTTWNVYSGVSGGHWVKKVSNNGKIVFLEDGSIWEISPIDIIYTMLWLPITEIYVMENQGVYPYKLINTDDGETAEAKYLGSP